MNDSSYPEFGVKRETISDFFYPPLPVSTFHDLVNQGKILRIKGLRGFFKLNESLKRLGLREVANPALHTEKRSTLDILHLAFALIDPILFPMPSWAINEAIGNRDMDHAILQAKAHRDKVLSLGLKVEKLAYFNCIIAAQKEAESGSAETGI